MCIKVEDYGFYSLICVLMSIEIRESMILMTIHKIITLDLHGIKSQFFFQCSPLNPPNSEYYYKWLLCFQNKEVSLHQLDADLSKSCFLVVSGAAVWNKICFIITMCPH